MRIESYFSLHLHNSFHLPVHTRWFMEYDSEEELSRILQDDFFQKNCFISIGEGSNLLFINEFDGIILHSQIKGITVADETSDTVLLRIGAAEHWDDVVVYAITKGLGGIENLSDIPGTAGAAALQNIGAYGVEIKEVVEKVEAFHPLTGEKHIFSNEACKYAYRHSFFKEEAEHNPFIITAILLRLQKTPRYNVAYGHLNTVLGHQTITLQTLRDAVIAARRSRLPDPKDLGNAGSFFINPVIRQEQFNDLKNRYDSIPCYPASEGMVKVPAGWLIEQCGFKGKREGAVGVYEKQALILVNYGGATGHAIAAFAEKIQQSVEAKFGIHLVPEVKYIY